MLWQTTTVATVRAVCVVGAVCWATGLSLAELTAWLTAPTVPVPVVGPDGSIR